MHNFSKHKLLQLCKNWLLICYNIIVPCVLVLLWLISSLCLHSLKIRLYSRLWVHYLMHSQQQQSVRKHSSYYNLHSYMHHTNTTSPANAGFLKSPHIMFRLLLKAYNIGVKPVISPFLSWYIKLLNYAGCILSITLKILYYLAKYFQK